MPFSIYKKLDLGDIKNISVAKPRGIVEDVLVKVDKFIFSADFVILDMEENEHVSLILGRTFLAMGKAMINVKKGELTLSFNNKVMKFSFSNSLRRHDHVENCNFVSKGEGIL